LGITSGVFTEFLDGMGPDRLEGELSGRVGGEDGTIKHCSDIAFEIGACLGSERKGTGEFVELVIVEEFDEVELVSKGVGEATSW
jgi:hypothetical protein